MAKMKLWTPREEKLFIDTVRRYRADGKLTQGHQMEMFAEIAEATGRGVEAVRSKYSVLRKAGKVA